ncbi:MAG: ABC transporter permease [Nitrospiraceae bacterium]
MSRLALRMAWRETRAAWRHFLYFFVCIALGVGALVGVALFSINVEQAVTREARGLMGGDLEIRLSRPMRAQGEAVLRSLADRGIAVLHVSELVGMAASADTGPALRTQIVELKAVESGYPFYGNLQLDPPRLLTELLSPPSSVCPEPRDAGRGTDTSRPMPRASRLEPRTSHLEPVVCYGAVVQQSLLIRLGLSVGDRFKVGDATFTITGVLRKEPDRVAGPFTLGPRVLISREGLAAAELIKPGSRVRERYLVKLPPGMPAQPLLYELRGRLTGESARVTGYRDAQPQLKQFLDQLTRYLGLIGLTALFIGGIGVATTIQAFIREKLHTIAILKTVGADSGMVIRTYLLQALLLGAIGSLAGAALGAGVQHALPPLVTGLFGADLMAQLDVSSAPSVASVLPVLKGVALGILTTLLFALWPLLGIREIGPARIFRRDVPAADEAAWPWQQRLGLSDRVRMLAALGIAAGLAGLAIWQAGNWRIGLLFIGALAAAVTVLTLAAWLLVRAIRRLPAPRSVAARHAIGNLHRPGSQAVGVMVSVGIGVMVIVAVSLLEQALVDQVGESRPVDSPSFFFIDIQPDQRDAFLRLLRERTQDPAPETTPLVRSRLHTINGKSVAVEENGEQTPGRKEDRRKNWYLTREYVLTFLRDLPKDNRVIKGAWWKPGQAFPKPLVSIEEDAAKNLGVDVGSTIEFEIQGAIVAAEVSNIRKVEWGNFSTNFYMIFSPGSLDGAPFTYVATVRVPPDQEIPVQQAVVAAFPNVTAINIGDMLDSFARILDRLALAIRAIAVFCILAGAIVLAAALAATRYRRLYESVVLKALGATRGLVAQAFAVEYALLGAAAGLIGTALASLLSWAVLRFILEDVAWTLQPGVLATGFLLTVLLSLVVGFLSTFRLLGQRPLAVLRHE